MDKHIAAKGAVSKPKRNVKIKKDKQEVNELDNLSIEESDINLN